MEKHKIYKINNYAHANDSDIAESIAELFDDETFINNSKLGPYLMNNEFKRLFSESLYNTSCDVAKFLWFINKDKYMCSVKNWYFFDNIWKLLKSELKIESQINETLPYFYKILKEYFLNQQTDDSNEKEIKDKINYLTKIIINIKNTQIKANIFIEAEKFFRNTDEDFENKLNTNLKLLGFNNGVFDFNIMQFRQGIKEDYISMSVGYDYTSDKSKYYAELQQFLSDIQPNKDDRDYLLTLLSLSLVGENTQELIHVFSGVGRNEKTKLSELLKLTFGEYFAMISATMLSKEQPFANTTRPELLELNNKRIVMTPEPEANQKLNSSFIKLLVGNDIITANIMQFNPHFNLILLCNDIPEFDKNDSAIWGRCIKFSTNEKQINVNLQERFNHWKTDFMLLLIEHYIVFKNNGKLKLQITDNIKEFIAETKDNRNIYKQYINEHLRHANTHIHTKTIYEHFCMWYKRNDNKESLPSNKKFSLELVKNKLIVEKNIYIKNKNSSGIRNLQIIN